MKIDPLPDLMTAACDGDSEAIEQMLLHYQPLITRFAHQYCATPQDIEDAVQETLWIASQKIGTVRVAAAFASWLFKIVEHQCYRLLHHKKREESLDALPEADYANESPEYCAALRSDVVTALAKLPSSYRQVVILRDIQGLTAPEVASRLELTVETVKSRLHRARNLLRESLQEWAV